MIYRVPSHVHAEAVHDEIVLLDARTEAYLGLNITASAVWSILAGGGSLESAAAELVSRFDVLPEEAQTDVATLTERLLAQGLLEQSDA
ncbi:MAG: PqqD family protein [Chloroflexota bacterium]|nr:PqqD family protein [Chloroflexota bacterium]